jgi:diaminopimelate epimerase
MMGPVSFTEPTRGGEPQTEFPEPTRGGKPQIEFMKGHGTGNDFVILPDPDGALELSPSAVARLCDRRFGIGGDGVLRVVRSAKHPDAAG